MAITATSLAATFTADALAFNATAATGATVGGFAKVDDEYMVVTEIAGTRISVRSRGDQGTIAKPHGPLAPVQFGLQSDLPNAAPGSVVFTENYPPVVSIGLDGTIDTSQMMRDVTLLITKATAAALTLVGPNRNQDGLVLTIVSTTAAAHVITYTAGFAGNTTGSDIATFAATVNGVLQIMARGGTWAVVSAVGVVVA
jgi:hypothetical protein